MRSARVRWVSWCAAVAFLAGGWAGGAMAQEAPPGEPSAAEPAAPAAREPTAGGTAAERAAGAPATAGASVAAPAAAASPRVVAVHRLLVEEAGEAETAEEAGRVPARPVGLGGVIAVEVEGLEALLADAGGFSKIVLFLDGIPLAGLAPRGVRPDRGWLIYRLDRTDGADEAWHLLLGGPKALVRELSVSVGATASAPLPTEVESFPLAVIHGWELGLFVVLLVVAVVAFVAAAARTDLLRDRAADVPPGALRPYSLSRCQMAWWFFLVVVAYVFIWLALDELDTITPSVLGLIGIGSATALGAAMIDGQKKQSHDEAKAALGRMETTPAAAPAAEPAAEAAAEAARQVQMAQMQQRMTDLEGAVKRGSRGFARDLLWDGGGMSLHRFQIVVWTLVLGTIFGASVYLDLAMPEFSATLLGLMGISSGTYLGFKVPERQQA